MQRKKCFLFTVGSFCRVKRFTSGKRSAVDEDVETEVRSGCAVGFGSPVNQWDNCVSVLNSLGIGTTLPYVCVNVR